MKNLNWAPTGREINNVLGCHGFHILVDIKDMDLTQNQEMLTFECLTIVITYYSLRPKMIVRSYALLEIEAQNHISLQQTFYIKKYFDTATSGDVLE